MGISKPDIRRLSGSKTLIVLSFLAALNPFWVIFALPVFIIALIGLYTSKRSLREKLVWSISPLVLWFPGMLLLMNVSSVISKANAQKIQFEIPENFRGVVSVYFPAPFGQKVKIVNGRELILVPESGIVFYSGEIEDGPIDWEYSVNGMVTEDNKAFHMAFSPSGGGSVDFSSGPNQRMSYRFRYLLVTNVNKDINGDSLQIELDKRDSIVQRCFIENRDLINPD